MLNRNQRQCVGPPALFAVILAALAFSAVGGCPEAEQLIGDALRNLPEPAGDAVGAGDATGAGDVADVGAGSLDDPPDDKAQPPIPVAVCPDDLILECDGDGNQEAIEAWLGSVKSETNCPNLTITHDFVELSDDCGATGSAVVTWVIVDDCGTSSCSARVEVVDTTVPVIEGPDDLTVECDGKGNQAELEAWLASAEASDTCGEVELVHDFIELTDAGDGTRSAHVTWTATDACGNANAHTAIFTVVDTQAPQVTVGPMRILWPPNHKYETYRLSDCIESVIDVCEGEIDVDAFGVILSIYSDEPENASGDGNTDDDIVIVDDSTFMLRAERRGDGNGRVYGISFEVSDSAGNKTQATCFVGVPHDQSGADPIDDGGESGYGVEPK